MRAETFDQSFDRILTGLVVKEGRRARLVLDHEKARKATEAAISEAAAGFLEAQRKQWLEKLGTMTEADLAVLSADQLAEMLVGDVGPDALTAVLRPILRDAMMKAATERYLEFAPPAAEPAAT